MLKLARSVQSTIVYKGKRRNSSNRLLVRGNTAVQRVSCCGEPSWHQLIRLLRTEAKVRPWSRQHNWVSFQQAAGCQQPSLCVKSSGCLSPSYCKGWRHPRSIDALC